MAIYHLHTKPISRSKGRSAIACAAYRSGEKLYSEETDRTFDYRNKGGVVFSEIVLCDHAPERFLDRQTLWNEVQRIESKADSRLAREIDVALPVECSREVQIKIARNFAQFLASQGMIVDWALHDKGDGNPHAHLMCTTRPITINGEWGAKEKKVYKLDANGERIPVIDPKTGEQKIGAKNRRMWQRETVSSTGWDKKETLREWRKKWADIVNENLAPEQHIDHRSYAEQGIEQIPTRHEGYAARKLDKELMEEKGIHADIIQKNIEIREQNELIRALHDLIQKLKERAGELYDRYKEQLREHGRIGDILDRVRKGFGIVKAGESGVEQRERRITRIVGETERREQEALGRESEINRAAETIGRREAKLKELEKGWVIHGSDNAKLQGVYDAIAKQIFTERSAGFMSEYKPTGWEKEVFDHRYKILVYVVEQAKVRKVDKYFKNNDHLLIPIDYNGSKKVAVVCQNEDLEVIRGGKLIENYFYLYADHRIPTPQHTTKPSIKKTLETMAREAKEREIEYTPTTEKPKKVIEPTVAPAPAPAVAEPEEKQEYNGPFLGK